MEQVEDGTYVVTDPRFAEQATETTDTTTPQWLTVFGVAAVLFALVILLAFWLRADNR